MKKFNIALDGPSGAGKSSMADLLAEKYNLRHLDTGAMYRAAGWYLNSIGVKPDDPGFADAVSRIQIEMPDDGRVIVNGIDVTSTIRKPEVSKLASLYASAPAMREKMVDLQQKIAASQGFIVDGRDICDVVLPDAPVKIYLDASPEARAERRLRQDQEKGIEITYEQVLKDIEARDEQDRNREVSPLRISKDAVVLDSGHLTIEQTLKALEEIVNSSLKKEGLL